MQADGSMHAVAPKVAQQTSLFVQVKPPQSMLGPLTPPPAPEDELEEATDDEEEASALLLEEAPPAEEEEAFVAPPIPPEPPAPPCPLELDAPVANGGASFVPCGDNEQALAAAMVKQTPRQANWFRMAGILPCFGHLLG